MGVGVADGFQNPDGHFGRHPDRGVELEQLDVVVLDQFLDLRNTFFNQILLHERPVGVGLRRVLLIPPSVLRIGVIEIPIIEHAARDIPVLGVRVIDAQLEAVFLAGIRQLAGSGSF